MSRSDKSSSSGPREHSSATCAARRLQHARMRSLGLVVTFYALLAATCSAESVGQPRNLTVQAIAVDDEDDGFLGPETTIKLNVSWLPPETGRAPKFYSVFVASLAGNGADEARRGNGSCMQGSVSHIAEASEETWIALPENRFDAAADEAALELEIEPGCSYRVQVFANPRNSANDAEDATSVVYKVPECVGGRCNCDQALEKLPVPEVSARNLYNGSVLINWKFEPRSLVESCKISVGIPHLTSSSGLTVYNKTQIFTGTSNENSFIWHEDALKKGTKIFVTVQDSYGCSGKEGTYTIKRVRQHPFYRKNVTAIVFAAIIALCVLFSGLINFVKRYTKKDNYALLAFKKKPPKQLTSILNSSRIDALLKNHNVLYVEQEIEEARRKDLADEHEISYARLRVIRELGQGQFGRVYLADLLGDEGPRPVAVKTSNLDSARAQLEVRQQLLEEIAITKVAGSHPHLVGLLGCCTLPDNPVCLVLEYMPGGDLLGYLHRMREAKEARDSAHELASLESPGVDSIPETTCTSLGSQSPSTPTSRVFFANEFKLESCAPSCESEGAISHAEMMRFALEIAKGMEHLEAKGIVHRDLAARNVLMDENLVLKISDFGLSRKDTYTLNGAGTRRLPIRWMPPEAIRRRAFTSKSDVWSYGLVLWEIGSLGDFPYPRLADAELLRHLLEEAGRPLADEARYAPQEARELMDMCWAAKPEGRPTFRQLVLWLEGRLRGDAKCNPAYREVCDNER